MSLNDLVSGEDTDDQSGQDDDDVALSRDTKRFQQEEKDSDESASEKDERLQESASEDDESVGNEGSQNGLDNNGRNETVAPSPKYLLVSGNRRGVEEAATCIEESQQVGVYTADSSRAFVPGSNVKELEETPSPSFLPGSNVNDMEEIPLSKKRNGISDSSPCTAATADSESSAAQVTNEREVVTTDKSRTGSDKSRASTVDMGEAAYFVPIGEPLVRRRPVLKSENKNEVVDTNEPEPSNERNRAEETKAGAPVPDDTVANEDVVMIDGSDSSKAQQPVVSAYATQNSDQGGEDDYSASQYEEETAFQFFNPPFPVEGHDIPGAVSSEDLGDLPIPDDPDLSTFPNTGKCKWSFDKETRVLLADFHQTNGKVELVEQDEHFLYKMMERDDITCVSDGLAHNIDPNMLNPNTLFNAAGLDFFHKHRRFDRMESTEAQALAETRVACKYKEKDFSLSMQVKDFARYVGMHEAVLRADARYI
jgi:hypothetical protein